MVHVLFGLALIPAHQSRLGPYFGRRGSHSSRIFSDFDTSYHSTSSPPNAFNLQFSGFIGPTTTPYVLGT